MGDRFGIRLTFKHISRRLQLGSKRDMVLDDSVVDDGDDRLFLAADVRVGVLVGCRTMGRPARVADPASAWDRVRGERFLKRRNPPRACGRSCARR